MRAHGVGATVRKCTRIRQCGHLILQGCRRQEFVDPWWGTMRLGGMLIGEMDSSCRHAEWRAQRVRRAHKLRSFRHADATAGALKIVWSAGQGMRKRT